MNQLRMPGNGISNDDEEEMVFPTADYKGLFHGWECPGCLTLNTDEENIDPREVGIYVECSECGWRGKVE